MRRFLFIFAMLCCTISLFAATRSADPTDAVIVAYKLTSSEEGMFNHTDGKASLFWLAWDGDNGKLDYIHLVPSINGARPGPAGPEGNDTCAYRNCRDPGFTGGKDDAQLFVRAAYGEKGLYLFIQALDDEFVGLIAGPGGYGEMPPHELTAYKGAEHWMNDCVDFFLDIYDSETQKKHYLSYGDQQTRSYWQYQLRFGTPSQPTTVVALNWIYERWPNECPQGANNPPHCFPLEFHRFAIEEAQKQFGILFEILTTGQNTRAQEWFIPWRRVGIGINAPAEGTKIAFTAGYNDIDGLASDLFNLDVLYWIDLGNPFTRPIPGQQPKKNWGDIEFGEKLKDIVPAGGGGGSTSVLLGNKQSRIGFNDSENVIQYFDINGRVLNSCNLKSMALGAVIARNITGSKVKVGYTEVVNITK